MAEAGSAPGPSELHQARAQLSEAQRRIDRATRELELATKLEARLQALLATPSKGRGPSSAARSGTEVEATDILLQAELRAAEILNATAGPDPSTTGPVAISAGTARALEHHFQALADIEESLVALARRALELP